MVKVERFGNWWQRYYELEVDFFKSICDEKLLDALWKQ